VPAGDAWSLVTAPDEQERCCVIIRNERCDHATAYRVSRRFLVPVITHQTKVKERSEAENAARSYESILSARYAAGGVSELALLEARKRQHTARVELSRALADRHADTAALFQAMGGGWWNTRRS